MRADLDDFQPRGDSQRKVIEALRRGPAATVAICGMGGGGKSVLAVHVAHDLDRAGDTPDGQRHIKPCPAEHAADASDASLLRHRAGSTFRGLEININSGLNADPAKLRRSGRRNLPFAAN